MRHEIIYYYLRYSKNNKNETLINAIELDHKTKQYTVIKRVEDLIVDSIDRRGRFYYKDSCVSKKEYDMRLEELKKSDWQYKRTLD